MAVLDLIHGGTHRNATAGSGAIAKFVADVRDYLARRAVFNRTLNELSNLSDRDLADLGLSRANLRNVAHDAAWGSK